MKINTNMAAQQILNNLNKADGKATNIMERLSSGLRINRAADDAAGLAIANKMDSQVRGLKQANRNAMDGISLIQTAEGAMNEVHSMLQRIRELTVQAANGTYTDEDREAISSEISELMNEMTAIQKNTEYNKKTLLNGSQSEIPLQVGANSNQNLMIDGIGMDMNQVLVGINGITADRIEGMIQEEPPIEPDNKAEGLVPGDGVTTLGPGTITANQLNQLTGPIIIADGTIIEGDVEVSGDIKFGNNVEIKGSLTVTDGDVCIGTGFDIGTEKIVVENGNLKMEGLPTASEIEVNGSVEVGGTGTLDNLKGDITNLTLKDSIILELADATTIQGELTLEGASQVDAKNSLDVLGGLNVSAGTSVTVTENLEVSGDVNIEGTVDVQKDFSITGDLNISGNGVIDNVQNFTVSGDVNSTTSKQIVIENNININGDAVLSSNLISTNGSITIEGTVNSRDELKADNGTINVLNKPPVVPPAQPPVSPDEMKEIIINGERKQFTPDEIANGIDLPAGSVLSMTLPEEINITVDGEELTIPAGESVVIQIGENATQLKDNQISFSSDDTIRFPGVEELEKLNESTLDLSSIEGTDKALDKVDRAITANSAMRSRLGAYQNRLEHTVSNLGVSQQNMTESLSRIQDADIAEEMANYTQVSVLTQAATSMLAQANQRPQQVLQLLNN